MWRIFFTGNGEQNKVQNLSFFNLNKNLNNALLPLEYKSTVFQNKVFKAEPCNIMQYCFKHLRSILLPSMSEYLTCIPCSTKSYFKIYFSNSVILQKKIGLFLWPQNLTSCCSIVRNLRMCCCCCCCDRILFLSLDSKQQQQQQQQQQPVSNVASTSSP